MSRLIDPTLARMVARRVAGSEAPETYLMERLRHDLEAAVPRSEALVAEASGIPAPPPAPWRIVDRATWAETNIAAMSALLDPVAKKIGNRLDRAPWAVRVAQRSLVSVEVGVLVGYISRRVLGQYDVLMAKNAERSRARSRRASPEQAALYFVGPNLVDAERRFGFVPEDFALWVAVHEMTHRFQFAGVPWLRERFLALVDSYLGSVELDAKDLAGRLAAAVRRLAAGEIPPEERNPAYLLASDEQRAALDEIQALMAVIEGHGNYVMDLVGVRVIPSFKTMRAVFDRRRRQQGLVQRAVATVLGLEMKLRQYEIGQAFCTAVAAREGDAALRRLWAAPSNLPSLLELREPDRWLQRVA